MKDKTAPRELSDQPEGNDSAAQHGLHASTTRRVRLRTNSAEMSIEVTQREEREEVVVERRTNDGLGLQRSLCRDSGRNLLCALNQRLSGAGLHRAGEDRGR